MRQHGTSRRAVEARVDALVHFRDHIGDFRRAVALQEAHDLALALLAVAHHAAHQPLRIVDRVAMRRIIDRIGPVEQALHRCHIGGHVAVRGRDDAGGPAHHMVAGEQGLFLQQREAEMVGGVAGRGHSGERPALATKPVAILQHPVGAIGSVERGIGARAVILQRQRRTADDRGAGSGAERRGGGAVVAMGVGAEDRRDRAAADRVEQRSEMRRVVRAGIDHRHILPAHQIGLRAGIGEGRRIGRQHARHQRGKPHQRAGREVVQVEGSCHNQPHVPIFGRFSRAIPWPTRTA